MRDAEKLREQPLHARSEHLMTCLALAGFGMLGGTFALGFAMGQRQARLASATTMPLDVVAGQDAQRRGHDAPTSYDALKSGWPHPPHPAARVGADGGDAAPNASDAITARMRPSGVAPAAQPHALQQSLSTMSPSRATVPLSAVDYTVQVSAHTSAYEAQARRDDLVRRGHAAFVVRADLGRRGAWHRVRVGRFADLSAAQAARLALGEAGIDGWVVRCDAP